MAWTTLPDDFGDQCADLTDGAFRIHAEAILWAERHGSGGFMPTAALDSFTHADGNSDVVGGYIGELIDVQLWRIEQHPPGFSIVPVARG